MNFFLRRGDRWITKEDTVKVFNRLKPFLNHGTIILTSNFQNYSAILSPTPIKHSSFCYIENDTYYSIELSNTSQLNKELMIDFLRNRNCVFLFDFFNPLIQARTMDYIFGYKNKKYGFFGDTEYCYQLIFNVYRDVYQFDYNKKYERMSSFFPVLNYFGLEFVNAYSILNSKKFIPSCCLINNTFITFKKKL